jgi:hypothetical protein
LRENALRWKKAAEGEIAERLRLKKELQQVKVEPRNFSAAMAFFLHADSG